MFCSELRNFSSFNNGGTTDISGTMSGTNHLHSQPISLPLLSSAKGLCGLHELLWPWWTTHHFLSTQHNMHSALKPSVSASACPGIPRRSAAASPVACSALSNSPHHHQADQRAPQEQQRCSDRRGVLLAGSAAVLLAAWTPAEAQAG